MTVGQRDARWAPHVEVELKYRVLDREALEQRLDDTTLGGLRIGRPREIFVEDRYVDTTSGALARAGYAVRLRGGGGGTVVSMKALAEHERGRNGAGARAGRRSKSPALYRRAELEGPGSASLDPGDWPRSTVHDRIARMIDGESLVERFSIRQRRHERDLRGAAGWAILSLDDVLVARDGQTLGELVVLEVEARRGGEAVLRLVARTLEDGGIVQPERRTKEELAESLVAARASTRKTNGKARERATTAPKEETPPSHAVEKSDRDELMRSDDPLAEAGRTYLALHFGRARDREDAVRGGEDPEDVHKMRVATRRMRAGWRLFADAYRGQVVREHVRDLRAVARRLGAVRDLDVLLESLHPYLEEHPDDGEALEPFLAEIRARREAARAKLLARLSSRRYRFFVAELEHFTSTPGAGVARAKSAPPARVSDAAARLIWKSFARVRAYEPAIAEADVATLHALRIEGKRLRYALEAFRDVIGPEGPTLIERAVRLQDLLGELHDMDVAVAAVRDWASAHPDAVPATIEALHRLALDRDARQATLREHAIEAFGKVVDESARRELGLAVAAV